MTMKVKAIEKKLKFTKDPNDAGVYRYVMSPEQYSSLNQKKVIKEAALRSGSTHSKERLGSLCAKAPQHGRTRSAARKEPLPKEDKSE